MSLSFREILFETLRGEMNLQEETSTAKAKFTKEDIDVMKFWSEFGEICGQEEENLYNDLAKAEHLDYQVWVYRENKERNSVDVVINGIKANVNDDELTYIVCHDGKLEFFYDVPSITTHFPESLVDLLVKHPDTFVKYGFELENCLKQVK